MLAILTPTSGLPSKAFSSILQDAASCCRRRRFRGLQIMRPSPVAFSRRTAMNFEVGVWPPTPTLSSGTRGLVSVVGGCLAGRDVEGEQGEAAYLAFDAIAPQRDQVDLVARLVAQAADIRPVGEYHFRAGPSLRDSDRPGRRWWCCTGHGAQAGLQDQVVVRGRCRAPVPATGRGQRGWRRSWPCRWRCSSAVLLAALPMRSSRRMPDAAAKSKPGMVPVIADALVVGARGRVPVHRMVAQVVRRAGDDRRARNASAARAIAPARRTRGSC